MNTYSVYARSRALFITAFIISYFILLCASAFVLDDFINKVSDGVFLLLFLADLAVIWFVSLYSSQHLSKGRLAVEPAQDGLHLRWEKNFLFFQQPDGFIPWTDIKSYEPVKGTWGGNYVKLTNSNGTKITLREGLPLLRKIHYFDNLETELRALYKKSRPQPAGEAAKQQEASPIRTNEPVSPALPKLAVPAGIVGRIYRLRDSSSLGALFFFVLFMFILMGLVAVDMYLNAGMPAIFAGVFLATGLGVLLANYMIKREMEIEVLSDRLSVRYRQQPFYDVRKDRDILFTGISSFTSYERGVFSLTLRLEDGTKFTAAPGKPFQDFTELTETLAVILQGTNSDKTAVRNVYEGPLGRVAQVFLGVMIAGLLIGILPPQKPPVPEMITCIGIILLLIWFIVRIQRIKRKGQAVK